MRLMSRGSYYAVAAYAAWGLFPIYFKWLAEFPALQLVSHRVLWSCLILLLVLGLRRRGPALLAALRQPKVWRAYGAAAVLIGINWLTFIWAVNSGFIVEVSLGYYINPLLSMLLGVVFLRERLRPWQWLPVALATLAVLYLTFLYHALPWIALLLSSVFAFYGLIKKTAPLDSFSGLTLETAALAPAAIAYLLYADVTQHAGILGHGAILDALLIGTGVATTVPLLFFAAAAQRISLIQLGMFQYIAPTIQLLLGIFVYGEAFPPQRMAGYALVWTALLLFTAEGYLAQRRRIPASAGAA